MSGVTGRSLFVGTVAGLVALVGVLIGVDAMVASARADSNAIRVVGGCQTVVAIEASGVYRFAVEVAGPAVGESSSCRAVPEGERAGTVDEVVIVAPDGTEAHLDVAQGADVTDGPGWRRQAIGSVRFDLAGEYVVTPIGDSVDGSVVTMAVDPSTMRNGRLVVAAVMLGLAVVVLVLGLGRRSRMRPTPAPARPVLPVSAPSAGGLWAPPDPSDRRG